MIVTPHHLCPGTRADNEKLYAAREHTKPLERPLGRAGSAAKQCQPKVYVGPSTLPLPQLVESLVLEKTPDARLRDFFGLQQQADAVVDENENGTAAKTTAMDQHGRRWRRDLRLAQNGERRVAGAIGGEKWGWHSG
jgi:hypothetical protein